MSDLVRKQFYINKYHDALLKERAKELGTTEAELVRQAIEGQLGKLRFPRRTLSIWQEESKFIQEFMSGRPVTGRRTWNRDDLYDI